MLYQFVVAPVERGFFCDDDSIRYPYLETPTINMFVLMVISVAIPLVSFVALVAAIERPSNLKVNMLIDLEENIIQVLTKLFLKPIEIFSALAAVCNSFLVRVVGDVFFNPLHQVPHRSSSSILPRLLQAQSHRSLRDMAIGSNKSSSKYKSFVCHFGFGELYRSYGRRLLC